MEAIEQLQWKKFKLNNSISYRDTIISRYANLVKFIACEISRTLPNAVELADLESYGYIGLMDAIEKYDPGRNIKFETYAKFRIRGAILDGMRKIDWLPRALRSKMKNNKQMLENKNNPDNDGFNYVILSYEEMTGQNSDFSKYNEPEKNPRHSALVSPNDFVENLENVSFIGKAISKLKNIEKKIVYYHYFEGRTFKEIGNSVGLTEQRASQVNKKALGYLRLAIKEQAC